MTAPLINPATLWYSEHEGPCCECCDDYCPAVEAGGFGHWDLLSEFPDGYVGTGRLLVHSSVLAPFPEDVTPISRPWPDKAREWAFAPETTPPLSTRPQSVRLLDRIELAGLTLHEGEKVVHIYQDGRHVGWCMWAKADGIRPDELPLIRRVASAAYISLPAAQRAVQAMSA